MQSDLDPHCPQKLLVLSSVKKELSFCQQVLSIMDKSKLLQSGIVKTFQKDSSKLKEFADDNFKFYENGGKFSQKVENSVGKGEIASY